MQDEEYSYQPKSNFSFVTIDDDGDMSMPVLVGEVTSDVNQSDRWQMLCQAIALVRLGQYLVQDKSCFTVMAVYVDDDFHVDRYLLYVDTSTGTSASEVATRPVSRFYSRHEFILTFAQVRIIKEEFDLRSMESGSKFLLGLYNLGEHIHEMAQALDKQRFAVLGVLKEYQKTLPSWTSHIQSGKSSTPQRKPQRKLQSKPPRPATRSDTDDDSEESLVGLQEAVDESEEMQIAVHEFGLTDDLFCMIDVCYLPVFRELRLNSVSTRTPSWPS